MTQSVDGTLEESQAASSIRRIIEEKVWAENAIFGRVEKRENADLRKSSKEPNKSCSMLATQNKPSPQHIQKYKQ